MKKRQLTPLALAVGLALISQVGLAKEQTGAVIKNNMSFTDTADTYTARDVHGNGAGCEWQNAHDHLQ